jgi:hypothetical protein
MMRHPVRADCENAIKIVNQRLTPRFALPVINFFLCFARVAAGA